MKFYLATMRALYKIKGTKCISHQYTISQFIIFNKIYKFNYFNVLNIKNLYFKITTIRIKKHKLLYPSLILGMQYALRLSKVFASKAMHIDKYKMSAGSNIDREEMSGKKMMRGTCCRGRGNVVFKLIYYTFFLK